MNTVIKQSLCSIITTIFLFNYSLEEENDLKNVRSVPVGKLDTIDVVHRLYKTAFFRPLTGVPEVVFDYLCHEIGAKILEARNVRFVHDNDLNALRRQRECKLNSSNRILAYLIQMHKGKTTCMEITEKFGWNPKSVSDDFKHVGLIMDANLGNLWIKEMNQQQQEANKGMIPDFPNVIGHLDGKQFNRTRSSKFAEGSVRKDYFCYKHRHEGLNVNMCINNYSLCTELLIAPGALNDHSSSQYLCRNLPDQSIMVDGGYHDTRFVRPLGEDNPFAYEHARARSIVENYFGKLSNCWKIVSEIYIRDTAYHGLVIRWAVILTNMLIVFENTLLRSYD